ncbi:MAG: hypothetical protein ACU0DT_02110, partial [Albimonas sp.]|uniref:hypothetical protein n=1 Tax=Albimonas sp. TaxID=1872425 RepID=UPI004057BE10
MGEVQGHHGAVVAVALEPPVDQQLARLVQQQHLGLPPREPGRPPGPAQPQRDQVAIEARDPAVGLVQVPVERHGVVEPPALQELLPLEQH